MTAFTSKELKDLRKTLQAQLDLADLTGMTIHLGDCIISYTGGEATLTTTGVFVHRHKKQTK